MKNDRNLQAPWVGQSDWDYLNWKTQEEEDESEVAYWDYIDRLIDEAKELEGNNVKQSDKK